jgi:hypothetical protein
MLIDGGCHCKNLRFALDWPGATPDIAARVCGCSFCVKHGGVWTSNPAAKLSVTIGGAEVVSKYSFGTETATFYVCARCGAVPIVTSEIAGRLYAVVNVNTFENFDPARVHRLGADFEGEELQSRLARRQKNWIADVRVTVAPPGAVQPHP